MREVAALRCGLDRTAWHGDGAVTCAKLLGIDLVKAPKANDPLPFDLARAHALYKALFGQVEDVIAGKRLLVVPSGPLTQLPFQALVTALPSAGTAGPDTMKAAQWLGTRHAITVLPAVSSLRALRQLAKPSRATRTLVAFANPLLDGDPATFPDDAKLAAAAKAAQKCPPVQITAIAPTLIQYVSAAAKGLPIVGSLFRGGGADLKSVRALQPLPDTTEEACKIARAVGAPETDVWLGARATERNLKELSDSGQLSQYRALHLATHGLVAGGPGDLQSSLAEPAIVLTPPADGTPADSLAIDDGLLTASEVAALKLDADWVILSACNTAAGGAKGAEALSGLARAFFYAGARALLVSHWEVYSSAAVELVTKAFDEIKAAPSIGRAEAMRRAMTATIAAGGFRAHPAYWAPFVVVGEGGRGVSS